MSAWDDAQVADTLYCDVSEWQVPCDDSYPHPVICIRSNDGTYRDKKWAGNYDWCRRKTDEGRLTFFQVYFVWRPNWQDAVATLKSQVGQPHPKMAIMLDVESWGGEITGNQSGGINAAFEDLCAWLGDRRRVIGYGNQGDLDSLWPQRPEGVRLVVAKYSTTRPNYPGQIAHQYTDGQGYGSGPQSSPPFGNCDHNFAYGLDPVQFAAELGIGGGPPMPAPEAVEKVLAYDHSITPQETGYWCGPAATQVVLNARGIFVSEQQLANEMGTDTGGTDYVGLIEDVLDRYVPEGDYRELYLEQDPISQQQKDELWVHLKNSFDAGWGVVMNWVAPPSNYPRGTRGSQSPSYGGGTVFHYVAGMGYYEGPEGRHIWIADSGFNPFGYWCSFDQVATLIPPKGYTWSAVPAPVVEPPPPADTDYVKLSYEQLCGPVDPATGYGTGWPQLGQNAEGLNLYLVDALAAVRSLVQQTVQPAGLSIEASSLTAEDYAKLEWEQLAGVDGHGWPQLGGLSITDCVAEIKRVLEGGTPPPFIPPPEGGGQPADRHALLTFSGTWAAPGVGYPSDVADGCSGVVEEVPVQAPWSMGPLGGASGEGAQSPSYQESVQIAVDWSVDWLLAHPNRTFMLGGYSQGGEAAARVHQETLPGGRLESVRDNFVAGYTFGNPSRQEGHTFYGGPPRPDEGIAQYRQIDMFDNWADECDDGDMYSGVPLGLAGEIMRDVYTMVTEMQLHDGFREFARDFAYNCIELLGNLDGDAGEDAKAQAARFGVTFEGATRLPRLNELAGRLGSDERFLSVKGIAAAIYAAVLAITFFAQGTAPHIEYHMREVFPGQTYLAHAIQHVHYWAAQRVPMQ